MKKKLIIFDLDGTLLDTIADLTAATNHALAALGLPMRSIDEVRTFVGNGVRQLMKRALPEAEAADDGRLDEALALFMAYYNMHNAEFSAPYPGITALLRRLKQEGMMLAVASNKYQSATEGLLLHYFPDILFDAVHGQRPEVPVKPNPMVVQSIMKETMAQRSEVLYVGDSDVDMKTANNAGVDALGVSWGFRSRESLLDYKPLAVVDCPSQILDFVL